MAGSVEKQCEKRCVYMRFCDKSKCAVSSCCRIQLLCIFRQNIAVTRCTVLPNVAYRVNVENCKMSAAGGHLMKEVERPHPLKSIKPSTVTEHTGSYVDYFTVRRIACKRGMCSVRPSVCSPHFWAIDSRLNGSTLVFGRKSASTVGLLHRNSPTPE